MTQLYISFVSPTATTTTTSTTINNYWTRLSKISVSLIKMSRRSIICHSLQLRQIIDLLATDKSRYFAITEFNNCCFIICSFDQLNMSSHSLPSRGTDPPFSHESIVSNTHEQNIICSKTVICRSHGELSASEKEGKKHRMITRFICTVKVIRSYQNKECDTMTYNELQGLTMANLNDLRSKRKTKSIRVKT